MTSGDSFVPPGQLSAAEIAARKRRSAWIALALFAFVIIVFAVTLVRLGGNTGGAA